MSYASLWNPSPRHVAVFRALQLGDLLCAVPALRALRAFLPHARITLIGLPWARDFVDRFHHYVDDLLVFPGFPGFPEHEGTLEELLQFFAQCRDRQFDVALQLHGSGEFSNPLIELTGAKHCAGFRANDGLRLASPHHIPWADDLPEVLRPLHLLEALGVPPQGTDLELPASGQEWSQWRSISARHRLVPRRYVCLHPGARLPSRRWPLDRFAAVGRALAADGWQIAITGAESESEVAGALAETIGPNTISLAGETSLGALAFVIAKSALLLCNDTGVSHVAAALGTLSVVVSSGADVTRWAPLNHTLHQVLWQLVPCRPCSFAQCPYDHHPCAKAITPEMVIAATHAIEVQEPVDA